jgi:hypothetical protein
MREAIGGYTKRELGNAIYLFKLLIEFFPKIRTSGVRNNREKEGGNGR